MLKRLTFSPFIRVSKERQLFFDPNPNSATLGEEDRRSHYSESQQSRDTTTDITIEYTFDFTRPRSLPNIEGTAIQQIPHDPFAL